MQMSFRSLFAAVSLIAVSLAPPHASAQSYQYVTNASSYAAPAGSSITVGVYLKEVGSTLIADEGGLFGAGFAVQTKGTYPRNGSIITGTEANYDGFGADSGWDRWNVAADGRSAALVESVGLTGDLCPVPDADGLIYLGSVTITVGARGTVTRYQVGSFADLSRNSLAWQFGEGNTVTLGENWIGLPYDLDSDNSAFTGGGAVYAGANDIINGFTVTGQ
jgi:predicted outer membrane repeat protein